MAVDFMLVDDAVATLSFRLCGSRTTPAGMDTDLRWALEWALNTYVTESRPQSFNGTGTIVLVQGTTDYALADDFTQMIEPGIISIVSSSDNRRLVNLTNEEYVERGVANWVSQGEPIYYVILGRSASTGAYSIRFVPPPSTAHNVSYNYRARPAPIRATVAADGTKIDRRFDPEKLMDLIEGAMLKLVNYDSGAAQKRAEMDWVDGLRRGREYGAPVVGQVYQREQYGRGARRMGGVHMPTSPYT